MRATIPRFLLTKPAGREDEWEYFGTKLPGGHRALFGFSSRQRAEGFLRSAELESGWSVAFLGYSELHEWLEQSRADGCDVLIRDAPSLSEILFDGARISDLVERLSHQRDTGDDIEAEFDTFSGSQLS
ncbi:MAG: hypothetical protein ACYTG0_30345 [Planctomycetota bacterium]